MMNMNLSLTLKAAKNINPENLKNLKNLKNLENLKNPENPKKRENLEKDKNLKYKIILCFAHIKHNMNK